jgi:hypothetical protein
MLTHYAYIQSFSDIGFEYCVAVERWRIGSVVAALDEFIIVVRYIMRRVTV